MFEVYNVLRLDRFLRIRFPEGCALEKTFYRLLLLHHSIYGLVDYLSDYNLWASAIGLSSRASRDRQGNYRARRLLREVLQKETSGGRYSEKVRRQILRNTCLSSQAFPRFCAARP